ncbi:MAG TPA: hypothetical protein VGB92_08640 [Longimicrobium sp.]|jgi:hypothetical protein
MNLRALAFLFLGLGMAALVTGPKLHKMAQIRGWLPGGTIDTVVVTDRWHQRPGEAGTDHDIYWITWDGADVRRVGPHRLNVAAERFPALTMGSRLEVIRVEGDRDAYLRDDIFASNGNFIFDIALLIGEMALVVVGVRGLRRRASAPVHAHSGGSRLTGKP